MPPITRYRYTFHRFAHILTHGKGPFLPPSHPLVVPLLRARQVGLFFLSAAFHHPPPHIVCSVARAVHPTWTFMMEDVSLSGTASPMLIDGLPVLRMYGGECEWWWWWWILRAASPFRRPLQNQLPHFRAYH